MKLLFQKNIIKALTFAVMLCIPLLTAKAQDARLQLGSLDHLAAKASQTVDVSIDERLIQIAAKVFSDKDVEEREVKQLIRGLKGVYVKSFEFDKVNDYTTADVESIRMQLRLPGWSRLVNITSRKDGTVEVYIQLVGDVVGGLAVLTTDDKELTVVNIVGPVDLEKLATLEGHLGIPDLELEVPKVKTKNEQ